MKVDFLILADAAQVADGKLYLLGGGFNVYRCLSFPAEITVAFAVGILFEPEEIGVDHEVLATFVNAAGTPVVPPIRLRVAVGKPEVPEAQGRAILPVNGRLLITEPGRYTVTVTAGESIARASFNATLLGTKVAVVPGAPAELQEQRTPQSRSASGQVQGGRVRGRERRRR